MCPLRGLGSDRGLVHVVCDSLLDGPVPRLHRCAPSISTRHLVRGRRRRSAQLAARLRLRIVCVRRIKDERERAVLAAVRAFIRLDSQLERILEKAAAIAETMPLYVPREKLIVYAIATHMEPTVSENQIDRALRGKGFGIARATLRATLSDLKNRGIISCVFVPKRGGTYPRWSIVRGRIAESKLRPLRRRSVNQP